MGPTCRDVSTACARGELETGTRWRRLGYRFHYVICPFCRAYRRQLRAVDSFFRQRWGQGAPQAAAKALQEKLNRWVDGL